MLEFKPISLDDREKIENYFNFLEEPFCDFTFGNLFFWSVVENTNIAFLKDFLFIRFSDDENFYYTFPIGDGEIKSAFDLILEDAKLNNKKIKFVCLNKNQSKILKEIFGEKIKIPSSIFFSSRCERVPKSLSNKLILKSSIKTTCQIKIIIT